MNETACAHSRVVLRHCDYPDGTRSDYWECAAGCGKQFWPEHTDMNIRNLRDFFAAKAVYGIMCAPWLMEGDGFKEECKNRGRKSAFDAIAYLAYEVADAMLAERLKD